MYDDILSIDEPETGKVWDLTYGHSHFLQYSKYTNRLAYPSTSLMGLPFNTDYFTLVAKGLATFGSCTFSL